MDSKKKIEDDIYQSLRNTFLATGRGRRPDLPLIPVNQKLLVQLYYLKQESCSKSKTWSGIEDCLIRIAPEVAQHRKRIRHAVEYAYERFSLQSDNLDFLESGVDFDFISETLSHHGITRASLNYPPSVFYHKKSLQNSVVVEIEQARKSLNLSTSTSLTGRWVSHLTGLTFNSKLVKSVKRTLKDYSKHRSAKSLYPERYQNFLSSNFVLSSHMPSSRPSAPPPPVPTSLPRPSSPPPVPTSLPRPSSPPPVPTSLPRPSSPPPVPTSLPRPSSPPSVLRPSLPPPQVPSSDSPPSVPHPSSSPPSVPCPSSSPPSVPPRPSLPPPPIPSSDSPSIPHPSINSTFTIQPSTSNSSIAPPAPKRVNFECLVKTLNEKIVDLETSLAEVQHEKFLLLQEVRGLKSELAATEKTNSNKRDNLKLKFESELNKKDRKLRKIKENHDKTCRDYVMTISKLQNIIKKNEDVISRRDAALNKLKLDNDYFKNELYKSVAEIEDLKLHPFQINLKDSKNNVYTHDVRKAVVSLICEAGVSAKNVRNVFQIIATHIFHYEFFDRLPCAQTALNMCDEAFVISGIQVVEGILNSENVTLHFDGTSRDQKKIVGHQFTLDSGETLYLGFVPVATENADTLLDIAIIVIDKLITCYKDISSVSRDDIFKNIFSKITSVMSDRAAPNVLFGKKFTDRVQAELGCDIQINFLHCNAHFLLGVSSAFEKTLSIFERKLIAQSNEYLGRDRDNAFSFFSKESESATNRLIRCTCNLLGPRGDQKNGCRPQWVTFCSDMCNVVSIPSYKSNRFNCFFQAAVSILYHYNKLLTFFTSGILHENPNLLIKSVALDLQDMQLMSLICCVALFCLKVTMPYWQIVKSNSVQYTDFFTYVQMMLACFKKWSSDPSDLLDASFTSVFRDTVYCPKSPAFDIVHDHIVKFDNMLMVDLLKTLCKDVCLVTERQLKEFLDDGYYSHASDDMRSTMRHCPLTNLVGESAFGDFDYDLMKRRNASLHNRSTIHSVKRNKTMLYLTGKSVEEQKTMFEVARKHGKDMRNESGVLEEKVRNEIRVKFVENQQKKIDKQVKDLAHGSKVERDVELHGGPCRTSADVDELFARLVNENYSMTKIGGVLKREIRFHKHVSGDRSLKFGSVDFMLDILKSFLKTDSLSCSSDVDLPSSKRQKL